MADCELIAFSEAMKVKTIRCETDLSVIAVTKFYALVDSTFWFSSGDPETNFLISCLVKCGADLIGIDPVNQTKYKMTPYL